MRIKNVYDLQFTVINDNNEEKHHIPSVIVTCYSIKQAIEYVQKTHKNLHHFTKIERITETIVL
jgi:hypothetical protein